MQIEKKYSHFWYRDHLKMDSKLNSTNTKAVLSRWNLDRESGSESNVEKVDCFNAYGYYTERKQGKPHTGRTYFQANIETPGQISKMYKDLLLQNKSKLDSTMEF